MNKLKYINLLTPFIRTLRKIGIIPNSPLINDRAMEYGFMAKEINFKTGDKILDIGFLESVTPFILAGLGADIHALDLRQCPINYPGVKTYIGDIRKTNFIDKFFDKIIAISTIEHLGIPTRYNSYGDPEADRKALLEMKRILTDDGIIIITVPFGKSAIDSVQKTYDKKNIEKLTTNFQIINIEYAKSNGQYWSPATYDEVKNTVGYHANVLISLKK